MARIFALGFWRGKHAYLRSTYNQLDFLVVVSSWVLKAVGWSHFKEPIYPGGSPELEKIRSVCWIEAYRLSRYSNPSTPKHALNLGPVCRSAACVSHGALFPQLLRGGCNHSDLGVHEGGSPAAGSCVLHFVAARHCIGFRVYRG